MKRIVVVAPLVAALAVLPSATVLAQAQGVTPGAASAAPQEGKAKPVSHTARRSRANVDARHCLKFATNLEIIKCAEKYR
jgi:hypothetical protein